MPKRARSGVPNLYKKHTAACRNREPLKCDCPWDGKYKRINVNLARWSRQYVDPRRRQHAVVVLNRLRASVDEHFSRPEGDYEVLGGRQTLRSFIVEWREHYGKVHDLDFASIDPMLRLIDRDFGSYTLEYLENASLQIERWPNELGRQRRDRLPRIVDYSAMKLSRLLVGRTADRLLPHGLSTQGGRNEVAHSGPVSKSCGRAILR